MDRNRRRWGIVGQKGETLEILERGKTKGQVDKEIGDRERLLGRFYDKLWVVYIEGLESLDMHSPA